MSKLQNYTQKNCLFNRMNFVYLIIPILCCGFYTAIQLTLPIMVEKFIDIIAYGGSEGETIIYMYSGLILFLVVVKLLKGYSEKEAALKITDKIRYTLLEKSLLKGQVFYNRYSVGEILEVAEKDIDIIDGFIVNTIIPVLVDLFTLIGIFIFFFIKNIYLGMGSVLITIAVSIMIYFVQKQQSDAILKEREQATRVTSFIGEIITIKKEINVMKASNEVVARMDKVFEKLKEYKVKKQNYLYRIWTCTLVAILVVNVISFVGGGFFYSKRIITFGFVYVIYSYGNMLKSPLENMQNYIQSYMMAKESIGRINDIISFDDEISKGHLCLEKKISSIKVENVFHKFGNDYALQNINFEIGNAEKLGIFGGSGSGKSTLCKILCKLYEIQEGNVFINDVNIKKIYTENLRKHIGYLTAGEQIFKASLKDNLDMFSNLDFETVLSIIKDNGLEFFLGINKSDDICEKLNSELDKDKLSSGQKQLINLIRLFFSEKDFVIFDEAAASISEDIEKEYFELLDKISKKHILIIITHNVERLEKCDKILMLNNGNVQEYGLRSVLEKDPNSYYYKYSRRIAINS